MFRRRFQGLVVREAAGIYRPRRPQEGILYRLLQDRFEEFALVHEERFEREDGPVRPVVRRVVNAFLDCGIPENGFARVRCPKCRAEFFVPFSCQTRNFCSSCSQKRALLFAEKLREEILAPVNHRHVVFTIPIPLRRLFLRERRLLGILTRCAYETVLCCFRVLLGEVDGRPGVVAAIQTFGSQAQWNPHVHSIVTDGLLFPGGEFHPMRLWDEETERLLTETYRRLVLAALVAEDRLSLEFREKLLTWSHGGGFSVYGRHLILNEEPARLAHMARYTLRAPVAEDRVREADDGTILLEIPPDPRSGDTVVTLHPLEYIRRMTNQIPDPGSHTVRYYGAYSNRLRAAYRDEEGEVTVRAGDGDGSTASRSRASWARLLHQIFEVDPLTCRCGAKMKVISVITAPGLVDRLLQHVRGKSKADAAPHSARDPPAA
jgi:hypothetical protein